MEKREPIFHELGHPADLKERFPGEVIDTGLIPAPMEVFEGDLLASVTASGGGLGDPIERDLAPIIADMDNGLTTEWQAGNIYCVKTSYDEKEKKWHADEAGTKELRQAKRKERLSRGVPAKEWWQKARQRVVDRKLDDQIVEMYQSSMRLSESFTQEYKDFWALPDDYNM
jgi:acetone carboxylase alpha subunit